MDARPLVDRLHAWVTTVDHKRLGVMYVAYALVFRHDARAVPVAAAVTTTAATVWDGWARAYPGALGGAVIAVALVWLAAYAWIRALSPRQEGQRMTVSPGGATVVA